MRIKESIGSRIFDCFNYLFMLLFAIITLVPFLNLITMSFSAPEVASQLGLHLFPTEFHFDSYQKVFEADYIWKGFANSILITVAGTLMTVLVSVLAAYPLSKKYLMHRGFWTGIIVFTMFFTGGMIPNYILIRNLGLIDNRLSLILPSLVNTFNMLIVRNFYMSLPDSIEESAKIDGANDIQILFRIVIPLSMSIIATVALWTAVALWNSWFPCLLYIRDTDKYVLQVVLRRIILEGSSEFINFEATSGTTIEPAAESIKAATVIVTILPIMCVYPFLQKYFVKGVMVGSLKG